MLSRITSRAEAEIFWNKKEITTWLHRMSMGIPIQPYFIERDDIHGEGGHKERTKRDKSTNIDIDNL